MSEAIEQKFLEEPIQGGLRTRLDALSARFDELEALIANPDAQKDRARFQEFLKERGASEAQVQAYRRYLKAAAAFEEAQQLVADGDPDLRELAEAELPQLERQCADFAREIRESLLDQDVGGSNDIIVEIRAGTGGDEAALFAADIFRMYSLYAERHRWKQEVLEVSETALNGYNKIVFSLRGKDAFLKLRFESGGHRVQRVPATETQGRIHTSAVTVAVLEEAEETEIEILDKDLRIDTFCASGPGGQKVNKTSSAVRITHIPTNIVVSIQDEKSQHKNKAKALRVLRTRIKDIQDEERHQKEGALRRSLIGSGDRSDRVRTYNFPQNRITDHRINFSVHSLERFMLGDIDEMIDRLVAHDREERVKSL
ncbi:MAG: peptide chain release factor 1 [Planctomycetota bacterium]